MQKKRPSVIDKKTSMTPHKAIPNRQREIDLQETKEVRQNKSTVINYEVDKDNKEN